MKRAYRTLARLTNIESRIMLTVAVGNTFVWKSSTKRRFLINTTATPAIGPNPIAAISSGIADKSIFAIAGISGNLKLAS